MEKRSRRRTRDLVTQAASQGLSQNEIGCARISMMARSTNAPCKGRIQMRKTNTLQNSHLACNARPVHTVGSQGDITTLPYSKTSLASASTFGGMLRFNILAVLRLKISSILGGCSTGMSAGLAPLSILST